MRTALRDFRQQSRFLRVTGIIMLVLWLMFSHRVQAQSLTVTTPNTPVPTCRLFPIALSQTALTGHVAGDTLSDIVNGTQPGTFSWLTWAGDPSAPTLATSLTPPGDSQTYINPNDASDHVGSGGDWITGKPGVSNSSAVRNALDQLESVD